MNPRARPPRTRHLAAALVLIAAVVAALASPLLAQTLSGFNPSTDYVIEIDGQPAPTAKIYWSQAERMFLVVVKDQPAPLLIEPVSRQVKSVPLVKIATRPDGSVGILEGAVMAPRGTVETTADGVATFKVDNHAYKLHEKPPLLGWQTADTITAYSHQYVTRADAYQPQAAVLADLKKQSADVKITIFFGSWCPFCQQKVPMAIRLARELAGSKVKFDFYGLPHGFSNDATAQRYGVKSVPTGIVYVNGKEVGRISGDGWGSPETTVRNLVGS
jgi:thiol-disulfide isomerase/thioredoxin